MLKEPEPEPEPKPEVAAPIIEKPRETPKVWVPTTIKSKIEEPKEEKKEIEIYNTEIPITEKTPVMEVLPKQEVKVVEPQVAAPSPIEHKFEIHPIIGGEALMPTINKNSVINTGVKSMNDLIAPKSAMLSSYSGDILRAAKKEEIEVVASRKRKSFLKLGIFIVILVLIALMVFSFIEGYIKIPGFKSFLVVKKDPKTTLLSTPLNIALLKSYKTETNIKISSPSLSNITTGLSSGDVVTSTDRDSVSFNIKGLVNQSEGKMISDYNLNFNSSIIKSEINTDLKYDGNNLYLNIPDLSKVLGSDAPKATTVLTTRDQLGSLENEFSPDIKTLMKKVDIYDVSSKGVPPYVANESASIFKDFINTFEYVDKGEASVHGIATSHYEIITTRDSKKKILSSLTNLFAPELNTSDKNNLDGILGASSISSFQVWTGKNDDHLYKVQFTLKVPLSKLLNINDSGIAGGEVNLDWDTTFYDLDIPNDISIPKGEVDMDGFIKNIENIKIKNIVSSFGSQSIIFKNAVGSYGKQSNLTGSCTAPIAGSIFSPAGHPKGADTAVSSISAIMNSLLLITKGEGSCYSNSNAWALAAPLSAQVSSYYCTDSKNNTTIVDYPIKGTSCAQ